MPKMATKAAGNVFYQARKEASKWNDRLSSREGASEETGVDRTRLAYIELNTVNPHPEEVLILSEVYNAPELCNHFCSKMCPLGVKTVNEVEVTELEKTVLQLLSVFQSLPQVKAELIDIAADGVIDNTEKPRMENIISKLDEAAAKNKPQCEARIKTHRGGKRAPHKMLGNHKPNAHRGYCQRHFNGLQGTTKQIKNNGPADPWKERRKPLPTAGHTPFWYIHYIIESVPLSI